MTRRTAAILQKRFWPLLTSQKTIPTLGQWLRMLLLRPRGQSRTLGFRSLLRMAGRNERFLFVSDRW